MSERERRTDDGTYPDVSEEKAKLEERAVATRDGFRELLAAEAKQLLNDVNAALAKFSAMVERVRAFEAKVSSDLPASPQELVEALRKYALDRVAAGDPVEFYSTRNRDYVSAELAYGSRGKPPGPDRKWKVYVRSANSYDSTDREEFLIAEIKEARAFPHNVPGAR